MVDYGSPVTADMVLARIDDSLYKADAASADAQLASAKAGVLRAQADLEQMKAKLTQSQNDWERAQKLGSSEACANRIRPISSRPTRPPRQTSPSPRPPSSRPKEQWRPPRRHSCGPSGT